ncbi:MAG: diguanylate cyclase [Leptolyngbya sp. SIO3F4]|nr:diguanylate cyclase [Leptolyngbya sp. SIO3F4]
MKTKMRLGRVSVAAAATLAASHSSSSVLPQALSDLSRCESLYNGDINTATATIAHSVVKNLGTTNCQIWLHTDNRSTFRPIAHYSSITSDKPNPEFSVAAYAEYFDKLLQRNWLVIDTGEATPGQTQDQVTPPLPYLADKEKAITALIEIPIYHQQNLAGILCCYQKKTPRVWQAAEKSFMLTAGCLVALAISHHRLKTQTQILTKQKRQLSLEVIERQQAEKAWQESQRLIQGILDASTNILYVNNFATGTNYYVNGYMETILGYSSDEIQHMGEQFLEQLTHPDDVESLHDARQKLAKSSSGDIIQNEYRLRHKQGSWYWMLCRETIFQWHQDGTPLQLLGTATDITVRKENEEALQQQNEKLTALARVDALTQIANRRAFDEFLHNAWSTLNHTPLTLILCDIDYFKLYNDTYGHQTGDECLQLVAKALQKAVKRQPDLVARYGGEEFAVVLPNTALAGAEHVAQSIQTTVKALKIEHRLSAISEYLTLSLGIATVLSTADGSPKDLITAADQGLYQAKSNGRAQFAIGYVDDECTDEQHENQCGPVTGCFSD